jgi:long-chain acyl-CoA synthetase
MIRGIMLCFREELHKIWIQYSSRVLIEDELVSWTGEQIAQKIEQMSSEIKSSTPHNSRVGLCFPNWASLGLAFLACIDAGRVPVLIDYLDIHEHDDSWIQQKHLSAVIHDEFLNLTHSPFYPIYKLSRYGDLKPVADFVPALVLSNQIKPAPKGTFTILYTSGSTGQSKGIFIPELGVLKTIEFLKSHFVLDEKVVAPIILPICYSMALNTQFLPTLLSGGKSVFVNSRLNFNKLYQSILNCQGTFLALIGDILHTCWEEKNKRKLPPAITVQHIQLAGGAILPEHLKMARELFPNAIIHKGYGLTEAIRVSMIHSNDPDFFTESVGKPLPFVDIEVRNEEQQALGLQQVGEICVRGPNVLLGICSRFEKPVDERGFLPSGDLGFINDKGHLVILGRKDGVFKVQGRRLSGFVYEREALIASPIVKGAKCIAALDDKRLTQKIILFIEIHKNLGSADYASDELSGFVSKLEEGLKKHNLYPKEVVIINKLPRTNNGKVQLAYLKKLWEQKQFLERVSSLNSTLKLYFYQKADLAHFLSFPSEVSDKSKTQSGNHKNIAHHLHASEQFETTEQKQ